MAILSDMDLYLPSLHDDLFSRVAETANRGAD